MGVGVLWGGEYGARKGLHSVRRPLGFQVAHAKLAPGPGIRRVFHQQLLQQADGGGEIRLSESLKGARKPIFRFTGRHSGCHSRGIQKVETRNSFHLSCFNFGFRSLSRLFSPHENGKAKIEQRVGLSISSFQLRSFLFPGHWLKMARNCSRLRGGVCAVRRFSMTCSRRLIPTRAEVMPGVERTN